MNPVNNQLKKHASARGYTLVELMVGLLLSVFIVMMTIAYLVTSAKDHFRCKLMKRSYKKMRALL